MTHGGESYLFYFGAISLYIVIGYWIVWKFMVPQTGDWETSELESEHFMVIMFWPFVIVFLAVSKIYDFFFTKQ